ncbi:hypothetical protein RRG08_033538 [Elysia crispata]|uniref:Uncharacterized protein n=1 Tax=Elysia crispata TaxID=231223 RepID=A0AAE0XNR4_9GAST|nr:hypothetical protein RRG08_033538 [Elysia crispata]
MDITGQKYRPVAIALAQLTISHEMTREISQLRAGLLFLRDFTSYSYYSYKQWVGSSKSPPAAAEDTEQVGINHYFSAKTRLLGRKKKRRKRRLLVFGEKVSNEILIAVYSLAVSHLALIRSRFAGRRGNLEQRQKARSLNLGILEQFEKSGIP